MVNAWILHVKQFAIDHNLSYGCAISTPACKESYYRFKKIKPYKYKRSDYRNKALPHIIEEDY
jgi:hypothetical protein